MTSCKPVSTLNQPALRSLHRPAWLIRLALIVSLAALAYLPHDAHAQARTRVVAYSGQQAPGTSGATFSSSQSLTPLGISDTGKLVFHAFLEGGDTQAGLNDEGLWIQENGAVRLLARLGDPVPELPGFSLSFFGGASSFAQQFFLDLAGNVAFAANVSNGVTSQAAFFVEENNVLVVKITRGMATEGGLELFVALDVLAFNQGRVLLLGNLAGAGVNNGNDQALMSYDPDVDANTLTFIAREGDVMESVAGGFVYRGSGFASNRSNPLGPEGDTIIKMEGIVPGSGDRIRVLYRWSGGQLTVIESSDGTQPVFAEARLNSSEQAAFHGRVDSTNTQALWHEGQKAMPVATEGDAADGAQGLAFEGFNAFGLFDDGRLVTQAQLTNNAGGIWMEDATGTLRSVAQVGSPAPGVVQGMEFFRVNNMTTSHTGQVAFSDLAFHPTTFEETSGLWMGDLSGLALVIARGAAIEVAAGDTRMVEDPLPIGERARTGADGHPTEFSGQGELLFGVLFMNNGGSAILVASSGLVVNWFGDDPDLDDTNGDGIIAGGEESDGVCDTGYVIFYVDGSQEPECTLRAAITEANAIPGPDQITYNIPGDGPLTIEPETPLPEITDVLSLIAPPIEEVLGKGGSARQNRVVILDGKGLSRGSGLQWGKGSNASILENHVIINFPEAGLLIEKDGVRVSGCYIGFDPVRVEAAGNGGDGIQIQGGKGVVIGGSADLRTAPKGNVIAFNRNGILICDNDRGDQCSGSGAHILGNRIVDNKGHGVYVLNSAGNTIGGTTAKVANTIARNGIRIDSGIRIRLVGAGIRIEGPQATGNKIQGNYIGIDPDAAGPSGNKLHGVSIEVARDIKSGTIVGGQTNQPGTAPGNVISGHVVGVAILRASDVTILGNAIGTDASGVASVPNGQGILAQSSKDIKIGGSSSRDRNLISGNFPVGIRLVDCESVRIEGNWFGLDQTGKRVFSFRGTDIFITSGSKIRVGGRILTRPGLPPGNVFAGGGITSRSTKNSFIQGNLFGADPDGEILLDESSEEIVLDEAINLFNINNIRVGGGQGDGNAFVNVGLGLSITGAKQRSRNTVTVRGNRFGQTLSGKPAKLDEGIVITSSRGNTIGGPGIADRNFITNAQVRGILLQRTRGNEINNNVLTSNKIGIQLSEAKRDMILNNTFRENTTAIKGDQTQVTIKDNDFDASSGSNTGLSFSASEVSISGNSFTDDAGDAIHLSDGSQATVVQNNIANNVGFGLNNTDPTVMVDAQANWWGDPSGPGGAGPGSGDAVSPGVDFSNWRSEPVSLVAALALDSLYLEPGRTDTVLAFVRNWTFPTETVEISLTDEQGWLTRPGTQMVTLNEEFGAGLEIPLSVPSGTPVESIAHLVLTATSQTDPAVVTVDSLLIALYEPTLASIFVAPDTTILAPGETQLFGASGSDQRGNPLDIDPVWSGSGGNIDAAGLFTAGSNTGVFAVSATDPATQIEGTAVVLIGVSVGIEEEETEVPHAFRLYPAYPNPFNPTATIEYAVKAPVHVVLTVYNVLGQQVAVLVDSDHATGRYKAIFDASRLSSGLYIYTIQMGAFTDAKKVLFIK